MPTTGGLEEPVDEVLSMAGKPEEGHPVAEIVAKDLMNESLKTEGAEVHMRGGYGHAEQLSQVPPSSMWLFACK